MDLRGLLVGVGFCGAFTTFSTYAVETLIARPIMIALLNVALNNIAAIGAAAIGLYAGMKAWHPPVAVSTYAVGVS